MVKTKDPRLIHIEIDDERNTAKIALEDRDASIIDIIDFRRTAAFAEIRKDEFIPGELIDLVEGYNARMAVDLILQKVATPEGAGLLPVIKYKKPDLIAELQRCKSNLKLTMSLRGGRLLKRWHFFLE